MANKLEISKDFTIEDIHKVREYLYYRSIEIGEEAYKKEKEEIIERILTQYPSIKRISISEAKKRNSEENE